METINIKTMLVKVTIPILIIVVTVNCASLTSPRSQLTNKAPATRNNITSVSNGNLRRDPSQNRHKRLLGLGLGGYGGGFGGPFGGYGGGFGGPFGGYGGGFGGPFGGYGGGFGGPFGGGLYPGSIGPQDCNFTFPYYTAICRGQSGLYGVWG